MEIKNSIIIGGILAIILISFQVTQGQKKEIQSADSVDERAVQLSFVPMFGTSRGPQEGLTNKLSLNILGGYEHSLRGAEFGGLFNIDKYDIVGGQFSGLVNAVGGSARGAQFSGFVNAVKDSVNGAQFAGFTNLASSSVVGFQGAGFVNVSVKHVKGAQIAGFVNYADSVKGFQGAGFVNVSPKGIEGTQIAGFSNISKDVEGTQFSAFFNRARYIKGSQVGLINVADSLQNGVAFGLINIIGNGMKQIALEHDDVMDLNFAFRSGTNRFYSVLFSGIEAKEKFLWSYGAGFGTQFNLIKRLNSNIEISTQSLHHRDHFGNKLNLLNRLKWNFGFQFAKHLAISAGPVLNVYVSNMRNSFTNDYGFDIGQNKFYDKTFNNYNVQMWVGYNVAIKF
ncbi:MAG: hypothetical protein JXR07_12645 [Reichenbachiella sp.]